NRLEDASVGLCRRRDSATVSINRQRHPRRQNAHRDPHPPQDLPRIPPDHDDPDRRSVASHLDVRCRQRNTQPQGSNVHQACPSPSAAPTARPRLLRPQRTPLPHPPQRTVGVGLSTHSNNPLGDTMDSFEELWNASGGPSLDPARAQNDAIAMAVRQFHESFTDAGFTDDQAWQITKEVTLAALLPVAMQQALAEDEDDDRCCGGTQLPCTEKSKPSPSVTASNRWI